MRLRALAEPPAAARGEQLSRRGIEPCEPAGSQDRERGVIRPHVRLVVVADDRERSTGAPDQRRDPGSWIGNHTCPRRPVRIVELDRLIGAQHQRTRGRKLDVVDRGFVRDPCARSAPPPRATSVMSQETRILLRNAQRLRIRPCSGLLQSFHTFRYQ